MMTSKIAALLILSLALPALAEEAAPPAVNLDLTQRADVGAVARLMAAQDLAALARSQSDPFAALTAAKILSEISFAMAARPPQAPPAADIAMPSPKPLFDLARALALDEGLIALIDKERALSDQRIAPATVQISGAQIAAGKTDQWELAFFAGALAEIAVTGSGTHVLDIRVTDSAGHVICQQSGPRDRLFCPFLPRENGGFTVTVSNPGSEPALYTLATN